MLDAMLEELPQPLVRLGGWEEQAQDCFRQTRGFVPDTVMHGCGGATSCCFAYVLEKCLSHLPTGVMRMVESLPHVTRWQSNRSKAFRGNKVTSKAYRSLFDVCQTVSIINIHMLSRRPPICIRASTTLLPFSALVAASGYPPSGEQWWRMGRRV